MEDEKIPSNIEIEDVIIDLLIHGTNKLVEFRGWLYDPKQQTFDEPSLIRGEQNLRIHGV
jgi:hypothetical protein